MAGFFELELDTTIPVVTILSPNYILNGAYLEFIVTANDELDPNLQEAKVSDVSGNTYNVVMSYDSETKEFTGIVSAALFDDAIATIEVSLWDEVHNKGTGVKNIQIIPASGYKVCVELKTYDHVMSVNQYPHEITIEEVTEC